MNEVATQTQPPSKDVAKLTGASAFIFTPKTLGEAKDYANIAANSGLVPDIYKGKPDMILIAWQMGAELGVQPMQALQGIAVINGKPSVWGDLALAIVQSSPVYEWHEEYESEDGKVSHFKAKRKDSPKVVHTTFSDDDIKAAGLGGKDTYQKYKRRMRQMRARAFGLRDLFSDVLKGMSIREEVQDYEVVKEVSPGVQLVEPRIAKPADPVPAESSAPKTDKPVDEIGSSDLVEFVPLKLTKDVKLEAVRIYETTEIYYLTKHEGFASLAKTAASNGKPISLAYIVEANGRWAQTVTMAEKA